MVPWKLILFLILMTIFVVFAAFNIKNVTDISVGFTTIQDVPVFLSVFIAFLAGAFFMLPFAVRSRKRKDKGNEKEKKPLKPEEYQQGNPLHPKNDIIEEEKHSDKNKDATE